MLLRCSSNLLGCVFDLLDLCLILGNVNRILFYTPLMFGSYEKISIYMRGETFHIGGKGLICISFSSLDWNLRKTCGFLTIE